MALGTEKVDSMAVDQVENAVSRDKGLAPDSEPEVALEAIGTGNIQPGYFYSSKFIGSLIGVTLMNISLYAGYVLPVRILKYQLVIISC